MITQEVDDVIMKMEACLAATNMTEFFDEMGYMQVAKQNARTYLGALRTIIPKHFNAEYNSPCWEMDLNISLKGEKLIGKMGDLAINASIKSQRVNVQKAFQVKERVSTPITCLPKVFLPGFPKCGSSFLYCVFTRMPGIPLAQIEKEPRWWIREGPNGVEKARVPAADHIVEYLLNFVRGSHLLKQSRKHVLTVDGSPSIIFDWPRFIVNEPPVNYCLLPSLIPAVLPDSKYIVVMRNPVKMLYSSFWFSCSRYHHKYMLTETQMRRGPHIFHKRIVTKINIFNDCMQKFPLERCVLNITYNIFSSKLQCGRAMIAMGLYYVHVHKWLSVVPRDKFIFFTMEELSQDTKRVARKMWRFAGIPNSENITISTRACANNKAKNTQRIVDYRHHDYMQMRSDTKELLNKFYQPFNKMLADLLGDEKFLWKDED